MYFVCNSTNRNLLSFSKKELSYVFSFSLSLCITFLYYIQKIRLSYSFVHVFIYYLIMHIEHVYNAQISEKDLFTTLYICYK